MLIIMASRVVQTPGTCTPQFVVEGKQLSDLSSFPRVGQLISQRRILNPSSGLVHTVLMTETCQS